MTFEHCAAPPLISEPEHDRVAVSGRFSSATLLAALSTSLHETITDFVDASGKISERIMKRGETPDLELVVGLQALDRLHQELMVYAGIVDHCAATLSNPNGDEENSDPIARITLADLKKRLHDRCCNEVAMVSPAPGGINY